MRSGPKRAQNGAKHVHDFVKPFRFSSPPQFPARSRGSPGSDRWEVAAESGPAAGMEAMQQNETKREGHLRELASKLLFSMENEGGRFRLYRDADVSRPVRHEGLTLDEVEEILDTWKLRGPHGG
jgi:hypothetical protein